MRKKFFSLVTIFCIVVLAYLIYSYYNQKEIQLPLASSTANNYIVHNDNNEQLYEQCYAEIIWQNSQMNLLYCSELEYPVIRAVADNNWNLIEDASIFNTSSQADLTIIEISPCASGIKEFSYLPADDMTSESEIPPKSGWTQISPNENGNYYLPLKEGKEISGSYYTIFKYVIYDYTYYGVICLSTIF